MIRGAASLNNSVVGKELRTRMRGWSSMALVTIYMIVFGLVAAAFLIQQSGPTNGNSSPVGANLFVGLAVLQLLLILLVTPSSTAGAISGERQRQTWDLLRVTRLSAFGIVWGKLFAGLAFNILLLFAALPIFSLVFLFGGVSPGDIVHVYVVFLASVILIGSLSLFISSVTRRVGVAVIAANIAALVLGVGLSVFAIYLQYWGNQNNGTGRIPPLTPLAQIDPFVALAGALPNSNGGLYLGRLGTIHNAFGLVGSMPIWEAYGILSLVFSGALVLLTTYFARSTVPWLARGAA